MSRRLSTTLVKSNTGGPAHFRGWKEWKKGDYIIGKYLSSYESTYKNQVSKNFKIEVLEANFKVKNDEGKLIDLAGETLILNGVGKLNKFMEKVKEGMDVEIEYDGKNPGKDGTLYHDFSALEAGYISAESTDAL
jgi:hypothetical protein